MNQLWQFWHASLSDAQVKSIIEIGDQYLSANAGLGFDGSTQNVGARSSEIRWINPNDGQSRFVTDTLWYYANEANTAEQKGKYDWHCDTFWANPTAFDRKLSIVIQLSDPSDYEGGDFEIDSQYAQVPADQIRAKGSVLVFPSFLNHRVTPITKGERRSLVSWIQGPKFR